MTDSEVKPAFSFESKIHQSWEEIAKAVWMKYPSKKFPMVDQEKVISINKNEDGFEVIKLKESHQIFKWNKVYSLVNYDFRFKDRVLNYRERVIRSFTKNLFHPLEVSCYAGVGRNSVDYTKQYFDIGHFSKFKSQFSKKHFDGIKLLEELVHSKPWLNLD